MENKNLTLERILRINEVSHMTGISKSTIYQYMDESKFPESFSLGGRMTGWTLSSIQEWIQERLKNKNTI